MRERPEVVKRERAFWDSEYRLQASDCRLRAAEGRDEALRRADQLAVPLHEGIAIGLGQHAEAMRQSDEVANFGRQAQCYFQGVQ